MGAGARVGSGGPPHRLTGDMSGSSGALWGHPPGWAASPAGRKEGTLSSQHLPQLRAGGSLDCQCLGGGGVSPGSPPCDGVPPSSHQASLG